ncbi:hypothetical protein AB0C27_53825 [Nonomuraea sp. NPDC048882]|uniref:hypothetical protein n=1 Tax=Nonomuraea sp. NPDC048882 TaxID=3154347 RepID=UPI0033E548B3
MTQTLIESPPTAGDAWHFVGVASRQVARHGSTLLTHPVDRAVIHGLLGASAELLGKRGRQHLAAAGDLLRRNHRGGQSDPAETALAQTLLALMYTLLPGCEQHAVNLLQEAAKTAAAHDGGAATTAAADGDVFHAALTGLVYAQLAARRSA